MFFDAGFVPAFSFPPTVINKSLFVFFFAYRQNHFFVPHLQGNCISFMDDLLDFELVENMRVVDPVVTAFVKYRHLFPKNILCSRILNSGHVITHKSIGDVIFLVHFVISLTSCFNLLPPKISSLLCANLY